MRVAEVATEERTRDVLVSANGVSIELTHPGSMVDAVVEAALSVFGDRPGRRMGGAQAVTRRDGVHDASLLEDELWIGTNETVCVDSGHHERRPEPRNRRKGSMSADDKIDLEFPFAEPRNAIYILEVAVMSASVVCVVFLRETLHFNEVSGHAGEGLNATVHVQVPTLEPNLRSAE